MSPELIAYLLSWAVLFTGYSMPDELPVVKFVPHSFFVQRICHNIDTLEFPCVVRAMYDDNIDGFIFLDKKYKDNIDEISKSMVVHEMVHYLQDMSGDWKGIENWQDDIRCQERLFREREGYMAQDQYMLDIHNKKRSLPRHYAPCGEY